MDNIQSQAPSIHVPPEIGAESCISASWKSSVSLKWMGIATDSPQIACSCQLTRSGLRFSASVLRGAYATWARRGATRSQSSRLLYWVLNIELMRHLCAVLAIGAISHVSAQEHATFLSSDEIFCNPERGFYTQMNTYAADWDTLSEYSLGVYSNVHTPYSASFQTCNTLILRMIVLDGFQDAPLSETVMGSLNCDFGLA